MSAEARRLTAEGSRSSRRLARAQHAVLRSREEPRQSDSVVCDPIEPASQPRHQPLSPPPTLGEGPGVRGVSHPNSPFVGVGIPPYAPTFALPPYPPTPLPAHSP